jgi:hypothetical protein
MAVDPNPKSGAGWEEKLHDAGTRVEEELKRVIAYINDEVVPEVRKNGSVALRAAAEQLEKLAQKMEERTRAGGPGAAKDEDRK